MSVLYYCPLEAYKERYTMQLSKPKTGWFERNWIKSGVKYVRIEGGSKQPTNITSGSVVDAIGRSRVCFNQIDKLLSSLSSIDPDDVIYFDDFWHPGIEALAYAAQAKRNKSKIPRMYSFIWAQSVDEFDFTYNMRRWMRHYEKGNAELMEGIFVACPAIRDLVVQGGIAPYEKVHAVGLPFSSEEVKSRMTYDLERTNKVIFSSRWDDEKNPEFFLHVVQEVLKKRSDVEFVICTSSKKLKSNSMKLLSALRVMLKKYPDNLILLENLSKEDYYKQLTTAKIQLNTADQDWVSFTLLEASCAGAYPVYPYFRSFPETFRFKPDYMYQRLHVAAAVAMINGVLDADNLWTPEAIEERSWIHTRFDDTWKRMASIMGLIKEKTDNETWL